jgi:hypothetical protein
VQDKDFWDISVNFSSNFGPIPVGGCQKKVKKGDQVLFAYCTGDVTRQYLKLSGPNSATIDAKTKVASVELMVTDAAGNAIEGATVATAGQSSIKGTTDRGGKVIINLTRTGINRLKGSKPNYIRSNQWVIRVRRATKL